MIGQPPGAGQLGQLDSINALLIDTLYSRISRRATHLDRYLLF
jgi:hypothetical protein